MLMPIDYLIRKHKMNITGIIHVGASYGQEMKDYHAAGIKNIIWIEAIPDVYSILAQKMNLFPGSKCFHACISNQDDQLVHFNITSNNGLSSSIFNLQEHTISYPNIVVVEKLALTTITLDTLLQQEGIELDGRYNFLNIDVQGAELLALQGTQKNLKKFKYIYLETNQRLLYEGCALEPEVDAFLSDYHFRPVEAKVRPAGWGEKFYIHES
jgi:FkbM family methyltransferase